MSIPQSTNFPHTAALNVSEAARQVAVAAATIQAAARTAEITHYRACLASAVANNCGATQFINALRELGTGGT